MNLYSAPNGTLTPSFEPHPCASTPGSAPARGTGILSVCQALAARLDLAAVVDVDPGVRNALATLGEWMRTGDYGTVEIAAWLGSVHRDVAPW
jgi:hypothetical protein